MSPMSPNYWSPLERHLSMHDVNESTYTPGAIARVIDPQPAG